MSLQPIGFRKLEDDESSPFGGALAKSIAQRLEQAKAESEEKKVPYSGLGALADVLSKSAYAGAVNPQMQLKAASNPAIWSQFSDTQKKGAANLAGSPGMINTSNPYADVMQKALQIEKDQRNKKPLGQSILDWINGTKTEEAPGQINQQQSQPIDQTQEYQPPKTFQQARQATQAQETQANQAYQQPQIQENQQQPELTPDQRHEKYLSDIARAKESGVLNAKTEKELSESYFNHQTLQGTLDGFSDLLATPEFKELRSAALAGKYEFGVREKIGTPEQQKLLGEFASKQGQLVQNYVAGFKGQAMGKEINLANETKPTKGDTFDVMVGKISSMSELNKMTLERERITAQKMAEGKSYLEAQLSADKEVNGDKIRKQIQERINPSLKPEHFTAQNLQDAAAKMNISVPEVIKMLEEKGITIPEGSING